MKKVCLVFNYMQPADGVCRTAISFANLLVELNEYEVTLIVLFKLDKELLKTLDPRIKVRKVLKIPYIKGIDRLTSYLPPSWIYKAALKKEKYDIEFGYCWKNPTIAISNSLNKDAKHIIYTHGYSEGTKYYSKADLVIAISTKNVNRITDDVKGAVEVKRFSNIYDEKRILENAEKEPPYKRDSDKFLFVTSGRMSSEKGYARMLEAANRLLKEGYDFNIWMIGDGPDRKALESYIEQEKIGNNVKILGSQINPFSLMKQGDTLICSSFNEGYSTVCVESCILEVPVLSTDISGADDIIGEAEAGKIVENSLEGIYNGMKYMLEHQDEVKEFKETLKKTKTKFYKENGKKRLIELMETINNLEVKR